jgi:hypothetical protein
MVQVAPQVVRERLRGRVPLRRALLERLGQDVVQVAAQGGAQPPRGGIAAARRLLRPPVHLDGVREAHRLDVHHRVDELRGRAPVRVYRVPSAQQEIEHDAQRVDVRGRGDVASRELLRRRILGGHGPDAFARQGRHPGARAALQQLGHAEVQQLYLAVRRHQDVRRLEIAVDDQVRVGVGHGG